MIYKYSVPPLQHSLIPRSLKGFKMRTIDKIKLAGTIVILMTFNPTFWLMMSKFDLGMVTALVSGISMLGICAYCHFQKNGYIHIEGYSEIADCLVTEIKK